MRTTITIDDDLYRLTMALADPGTATADLGQITVPVLTIGGRYDTMDPACMEKIAGLVGNGRFLYCANGSHMAMYDDQETYFASLTKFVEDVDQGRF
jgi:proline iminopeptidase